MFPTLLPTMPTLRAQLTLVLQPLSPKPSLPGVSPDPVALLVVPIPSERALALSLLTITLPSPYLPSLRLAIPVNGLKDLLLVLSILVEQVELSLLILPTMLSVL